MDARTAAEEAFRKALLRARALCDLQEYLERNHTAALYVDDMLRAAVVMTVSAFDYLVHEVYRVEAVICFRERRLVPRIELPLSVIHASDRDIESLVGEYVREKNSYKTFVDPGKFAEAISVFVDDPWDKIASELGVSSRVAKTRLRAIYRWRNRIAHEADINPEYAGAELWPIVRDDVRDAINEVESLGQCLLSVMRQIQPTPATSAPAHPPPRVTGSPPPPPPPPQPW